MISEFDWPIDSPEVKAFASKYHSANDVKAARVRLEKAMTCPRPSQRKIKNAERLLAYHTKAHQSCADAILALESAVTRRKSGENAICSLEAASKLKMSCERFERIVGLMELPAIVRYGSSGVYEPETAMKAKIYTSGYELDRIAYEEEHGVSLDALESVRTK